MYDVSDTKVRIMLATQRFGTENYQLEFLYYGSYIPVNNKHSVIFIQSPITNMHFPNMEQHVFENFHFISKGRLDIIQMGAADMGACPTPIHGKQHDHPGTNWAWRSAAFCFVSYQGNPMSCPFTIQLQLLYQYVPLYIYLCIWISWSIQDGVICLLYKPESSRAK